MPSARHARGFEYGRSDNPTRRSLEAAIAVLEGAEHGFAYASGLAATQNILYLTEPGQRVVMCDDVYGGTWRLADKVWSRYGVNVDPVDVTDPEAVRAAVSPEAVRERGPVGLVWIETPTNPLLKIADIARDGRGRASGRCADRGRQHVRHALPAATAGPWRRHRHALGHQVPWRPLGRGRWAGRHQPRRPGGAAALPPERRRRGAVAVRLLAGAARHADTGGPHGARLRQCHCHRLLARRAARGAARLLPRPARQPGARAVRAADATPRRAWSASS